MTAQAGDVIHIGGRVFCLLSNPLEALWSETRPRPRFVPPSTGLWRGYVATWIIEDNRLCLTEVKGLVSVDERGGLVYGMREFMEEPLVVGRDSTATRPVSLPLLFPGAGDRVHAEWFTGELRVPEGPPVHYVHMGYQSVYERELCVRIECGMVVASEVLETGKVFRRDREALKRRLDRSEPAQADAGGWLRCPHCGRRFTVRDKRRWDGERHDCGGRINLEGTVSD